MNLQVRYESCFLQETPGKDSLLCIVFSPMSTCMTALAVAALGRHCPLHHPRCTQPACSLRKPDQLHMQTIANSERLRLPACIGPSLGCKWMSRGLSVADRGLARGRGCLSAHFAHVSVMRQPSARERVPHGQTALGHTHLCGLSWHPPGYRP